VEAQQQLVVDVEAAPIQVAGADVHRVVHDEELGRADCGWYRGSRAAGRSLTAWIAFSDQHAENAPCASFPQPQDGSARPRDTFGEGTCCPRQEIAVEVDESKAAMLTFAGGRDVAPYVA